MDESRNFVLQMINVYRGLSPDRKVILAVCIIVFVAAIWFWISATKQPEYALLYGDLNLKDSGTIVAELQTRNIAYKLSGGGSEIMVPADKVYQLRIDLASQDILPSGSTGFELFDKTNLGLTEFTQNINKQRAIQGELERTLREIEGVEFARVHLNIPEQSPFIEDIQEAKGSVMVKLAPRYRTLDANRVAAIQNLVATADSRLQPEKISVIDSKLNLLSVSRDKAEDYAGLPDRLALQSKFEEQETQKIKDFLERRFGPGNVAVGVSAELNFDRIEKESKTFTPVEGTLKGVLNKEELEDEKTTGGASQGAQGVPGTSSNIPGYPGAQPGTYENKRSKESKEYSVSESSEHTILAPGDVEKLSVSVLVNSEEEDPAVVTEVEGLILAATNLDQTRGDKIKVTMAPFDTTYLTELEAAQAEAAKFDWKSLIKWVPPAVVLLFAFIIFMRLMKPVKEAYRAPRLDEVIEEEEPLEMPTPDPAAMRKLKMREEIARLADQDPESAARIIKTWLSQ